VRPEWSAGTRYATCSIIYALGALFFVLTGRAPFDEDSKEKTLTAILNKEASFPAVLTRAVPRDLQTIALKCLEKNPAAATPPPRTSPMSSPDSSAMNPSAPAEWIWPVPAPIEAAEGK